MRRQELLYLAERLIDVSSEITKAVESGRRIWKKENERYKKMLELVGRADKEEWHQTPVEHIKATRSGRFKFDEREIHVVKPTRLTKMPVVTYGTKYKRHQVNVLRLMYDTFVRVTDPVHECVVPRDGDVMNWKVENLMVMTRRQRMEEVTAVTKSRRTGVEAAIERVAIAKEEADLAVYFATTGRWDRYHKYVEEKLYGRLVDYGLNTLDKKGKSWVMDAVEDAISEMYRLIDTNRGMPNITDMCKKIMCSRAKGKRDIERRYNVRRCERPVDCPVFGYLAVKYGLIESYRD